MTTILIIEDEPAIAALLRLTLEQAGYAVHSAESAEAARILLRDALPDLLIVDWMLPGQPGTTFIRNLRDDERSRDLPIILLTARGEERDKESGLNLGADDYITKPFSPRELLARINALLRRRAPQKTPARIASHGLVLDPVEQHLFAHGKRLACMPAELKLLHFFMTHAGRTYSRRQLLDLVWGDHVFVEERTVDVHIRRLRKVLAEAGLDSLIETVRGSGYRFTDAP